MRHVTSARSRTAGKSLKRLGNRMKGGARRREHAGGGGVKEGVAELILSRLREQHAPRPGVDEELHSQNGARGGSARHLDPSSVVPNFLG